MFGVGPMEILITWMSLIPSLWGLPVGIPPAPEDPLMAKIAPEECLFYTTWSGTATADPSSPNQAEQMMAEPELQRVLQAIDRQLQLAAVRLAALEQERAVAMTAELAPRLLKLLLSQSGALYVSAVQPGPNGLDVQGAALLRLGENEREIARLLHQLPLEGTRHVLHDGVSFQVMVIRDGARKVSWGIWRNCLVIGMGEGTIAQLVARADREPPAWWSSARQRLEVPRVSSLAYLNLQRLWDLMGQAAGADAPAVLAALGLDSATSVISVCGLDDTGFVSRSLIEITGPSRGILKLLDAEPLREEELKSIPHNAHAATAFRLDPAQFWDTLLDQLGQVKPEAALELREGLRQFESALAIDIQDDLLPSLGDAWCLYCAPGNGGLLTGWTVALSLDKPDRVRRIQDRLVGMLRANSGPVEVRVLKMEDREVHYLVTNEMMDMPFSPSWSLSERELVVGLFPQAVVAHFENANRVEPLTSQPAWSRIWSDEGPLSVSYVDLRPVLELVYPFLQFTAQAGFGEARRNGFDLDISLIPSAGVFSRHLGPSVGRSFRTADGLEFERRQSLPGGSVGSTLPVTIALLLPAVEASRSAARRTQGMNNLKQIGLAMHNYHEVHRAFPPAYSIDDEKKPLLSWRVHLLPFLEEQALYKQFRLDEPWDSQHNRALVDQMPQVFQAPGAKREDGRTNYLAPRGERTIFVPPRENQAGREMPVGTGMRDITDGTSNTIAVVEASDALAVIWTKPDDYEYDPRQPLDGLVGLREGGFMALLTDGSVRFVSALVDPQTLNALYTRNGGEVIGGF